MFRFVTILLSLLPCFFASAFAELKEKDNAPIFKAKLHDGTDFNLADHKGKKWTVLYFYPKAETPGCTKQACAFRDNLKIFSSAADLYGISTDTVEDQKKFHEHHKLSFPLIADPDAKVTELYGAKTPVVKMAKRWTFIIDPDLKVRSINTSVDPAQDPFWVKNKLVELGAIKEEKKDEKKSKK